MTTRKEIFDRIKETACGLYGGREASSIACIVMDDLCGVSKLDLALGPDVRLEWSGRLERAVKEIGAGRPVQYVTGRAFFRGREFAVGKGVLIPRPETEELVEWVVRGNAGRPKILDMGTGSGAIAVSLAAEMPGADITAADISERALAFAEANAQRNGVNVKFVQADVLSADAACKLVAAGEKFDIVVSNPPYIPRSEAASMHRNVTGYEPQEALFVDDSDRIIFYRAIARLGHGILAGKGQIYFEIHENSGGEVAQMLAGEGYAGIEVRKDINGKERMMKCRKK